MLIDAEICLSHSLFYKKTSILDILFVKTIENLSKKVYDNEGTFQKTGIHYYRTR